MTYDAATTAGGFRHEALFYAGGEDFLARTEAFIREGLAQQEPVFVVVDRQKVEALRGSLGTEASRVRFADMQEIGRNPARIIPAWIEFVAEQAGRGSTFRGIGEPIWSGRGPEELVECQRHEALLNLAFADSLESWILLCPYDTTTLPLAVLDEARRSHPIVSERGEQRTSGGYLGLESFAEPFLTPLSPAPHDRIEVPIEPGALDTVRGAAARAITAWGLAPDRTQDFVLAINEIATNSVRHGGGRGTLRLWATPATAYAEIVDEGHIDAPLAGRVPPAGAQEQGVGLWLVNQLCDLVQVRSSPSGSVIRMHMSR